MATMKGKEMKRTTIYEKFEPFNIFQYDYIAIPMPLPSRLYSYDHFRSLAPASIDYSPYQPAPLITLILEEKELREAQYSQLERFWRVWYTERGFYAPKLQTLIIGLRVGHSQPATRKTDDGATIHTDCENGINKFLGYFDSYVYRKSPDVGLQMYILNDEAKLSSAFRILP